MGKRSSSRLLSFAESCFHRWQSEGFPGIAVILLCLQSLLLIGIAAWHSPVSDELVRLEAGYHHWKSLEFGKNPGNPPLNDLIAAAPIMIFSLPVQPPDPEPNAHQRKPYLPYVFVGRLALIPFSVLGGWICFAWARELYGHVAGLLVLVLWCFDPMILHFGGTITGDMCATSLGITSAWVFWQWMRKPDMGTAVISGIALGFALLAKYVWVILPPLFLILWTARRFACPRPSSWPLPGQMLVMSLLVIYVINAGYGFDRTLQPWATFRFRSPVLQQFAVDPATKGSGKQSWFESIPIPVPQQYVQGVDAIADHLSDDTLRRHVQGDFIERHISYYYLYGLLVKVPVGTWLLILVAVWDWLSKRWGAESHQTDNIVIEQGAAQTHVPVRQEAEAEAGWWTTLVFWLPALSVLVFVSSVTTNKQFRYILPMLPFVFVWVGRTAVWAQCGSQWRKLLVLGFLSWATLSSLKVYPHCLSYVSEVAGGPGSNHLHLSGLAGDWGQDMLFLKSWLVRHQGVSPLYVNCHNMLDPDWFEIHSQPVPSGGPQPGWYALSVNVLRGVRGHSAVMGRAIRKGDEYLEHFLQEQPVATAGYSIRIYHLDCDQANTMRAKLGLEAIDCGERSGLTGSLSSE